MSTYLMHHGVKGQKWGVRRYQNPDGSLTEAGRKRYSSSDFTYSETTKYGDNKFRSKDGATIETTNKKIGEKEIAAMTTYLIHHGILGQKWGIRRYQNPDGSLTKAGKKRYAKETMKTLNKDKVRQQKIASDMGTAAVGLGGLYYELTGDKKKKEEFYEEHRKALEEGRLVVKALFKEDYSDGSVTGSIDGVPISKIKIDTDGHLISEIFDEDILYAQADFLDYIQNYEANKNKSKEDEVERVYVDFEDFLKGDTARNKRKLSSEQKKTAKEIETFRPEKKKTLWTQDEALEYFNKEFHKKFGNIDLMEHQELLDAYDSALYSFIESNGLD